MRKSADRLVLFAPVIPNVAHDKQRETAAERAKKGPSARRYTQQPVRHWDHWLHENVDLANTHVIAYAADGTNRVDLTPAAKREFAIEPQLDVSADGTLVAVTRQTPGADRELDTTILLIDIASTSRPCSAREPTSTTSRCTSRPTARRSPRFAASVRRKR